MTCRHANFPAGTFGLSAAILLPLALAAGCAGTAERDVLFQTATLGALVEGVYDGNLAIGELKKHGDLGLGTFDALDGEMVMLDGRVYRVRADGKAEAVGDEETTPFATVTFFDADHTGSFEGPFDLAHLEEMLDKVLPTKNIPYAVRIEGTFARVKTRSIPRQTKPYPRLPEVTAKQPTFELENVRGTLVGFRCPQYAKGLNLPGWHLHFLTADRTAGGHVLELVTEKVRFAIDYTFAIHVALPAGGAFYEADLASDKTADLKRTMK
ncbi:MAG: acetolactate decarboxylase [Planctomycetota bacterium]|nr:acetolactate decarboxylase [Planctomycetota bacterium]